MLRLVPLSRSINLLISNLTKARKSSTKPEKWELEVNCKTNTDILRQDPTKPDIFVTRRRKVFQQKLFYFNMMQIKE